MTAHSKPNDEHGWLAERFEDHRGHLRAVAYRMLGSASDADDAVQEAWLRLSRAKDGTASVENLRAWLTTVVARVCLNMLRSRASRREEAWDSGAPEKLLKLVDDTDVEREALLADSVGLALLVVLDKLAPAERIAFVLHDLFDLPFEEIAPIVGRSPAAARQLASRARRRIQGSATVPDSSLTRRRQVVDAFLAAARGGDFEALLELLDPDVVLRTVGTLPEEGDEAWRPRTSGRRLPHRPVVLRGAKAVVQRAKIGAARFARFCQVALVDGAPGLVVAPRGRLLRVLTFKFRGDRIVGINVVADPERLRRFDLALVGSADAAGFLGAVEDRRA